MVHDAPYTDRARFIMGMVSKTMSLTAKQNPETLGNMRQDLLELYKNMQAESDDELRDEDTSTFVAVAAADDDQDQGFDG
jgi:hypothetical protein